VIGVFKPEFVIGIVSAWEETDELDQFVLEHPKLFSKSGVLVNGYVNYVMFWDGSKEGWDDSIEGDRLRNTFLQLLKRINYTKIYYIEHEKSEPTVSFSFVWEG